MALRFFIDSSVLFSAMGSETGAARELLRLALFGEVNLFASGYVFQEVRESLTEKGKQLALKPLQTIHDLGIFELVETTLEDENAARETVDDPEDIAIVAAAKIARVDALVSFDRKHLHTKVVSEYISAPVITAGDALKLIRERE